MATNDLTVYCPACGLTVPDDRAADLNTPAGTVAVCKACHPDRSALDDGSPEVDHA